MKKKTLYLIGILVLIVLITWQLNLFAIYPSGYQVAVFSKTDTVESNVINDWISNHGIETVSLDGEWCGANYDPYRLVDCGDKIVNVKGLNKCKVIGDFYGEGNFIGTLEFEGKVDTANYMAGCSPTQTYWWYEKYPNYAYGKVQNFKLIFYANQTVVECNVPAECQGKPHIECVGSWSCENNTCEWICEPEPPIWNLKDWIIFKINQLKLWFCNYFGIWC